MRQISRKEHGAAGNTERYGNVLSLGNKSVSANTADWGRAYSSGDRGTALNTGNCGWAVVSGRRGEAAGHPGAESGWDDHPGKYALLPAERPLVPGKKNS